MPGPDSDSYNTEFGVGLANEIRDEVQKMYDRLTLVLDGRPPKYIGDIVRAEPETMDRYIPASFSERQWRILRFALERALDSL